jgi:hypothetical protein
MSKTLEFTLEDVRNWLKEKHPNEVVHHPPHKCSCTLVRFIREQMGMSDVELEGFGRVMLDEERGTGFAIPTELVPWLRRLDSACGYKRTDKLTAAQALEVMDTGLQRGT